MTEMELKLRQKVVKTAEAYLGCRESDGSHRPIIDVYNTLEKTAGGLPVGYRMPYDKPWCSVFVSAIAILCGLTDIIPPECGCGRHIELFRKLGIWVEKDGYVPTMGDIILYSWNDNGKGECTEGASHIGYVVSCDGNAIKVIEGNISDSVGYRTLAVNGQYIRGFAVPDYASKVKPDEIEELKKRVAELEKIVAGLMDSVELLAKAVGNSYHSLGDVRADEENAEFYLPTLNLLIDQGHLRGKGGDGDDMILDLPENAVRLLVFLDRAGVFGE
jgi:hypothetical protein